MFRSNVARSIKKDGGDKVDIQRHGKRVFLGF